jgi:hypothetical protein
VNDNSKADKAAILAEIRKYAEARKIVIPPSAVSMEEICEQLGDGTPVTYDKALEIVKKMVKDGLLIPLRKGNKKYYIMPEK